MQPFHSAVRYDDYFTPLGGSCEMIAFDSEHINVFAAEVIYCQPHWHEAPELIYVLRGGFEITVHQTAMQVHAGAFLYIGQDLIHSLEQSEQDSALVTWQFAPKLFDLSHPAPTGYFVLDDQKPGHSALLDVCAQHLSSINKSDISSFARVANIYQILTEIDRNAIQLSAEVNTIKTKEERIIRDSIDYINNHFHQLISVADLAEKSSVSYYHFSRLFKKVSGYTPAEYISMIRVNMAKPMLKDIHRPITEISFAVGFNEHRRMIAAFKKYCGVTPSEYRKQFLSDKEWRSASQELLTFPYRPIKLNIVTLSPD